MTNKELTLPFYAKTSLILMGLFVGIWTLYIMQSIIIPLIFAFIIAILLNPVVGKLEKWMNRTLAISITLSFSFIIIISFGILLATQITLFSDAWPLLIKKIGTILNQTIGITAEYLDIGPEQIHDWIRKSRNDILNSISSMLGNTILSIGNLLATLIIIPIYTFIILYYKKLLREFIVRIFASSKKSQLTEIVSQIKIVIQHYLTGLVIEAIIVAVLDIIALWTLGIDYAILLGIIGAMLNVIPYIGGIVAFALPMLLAIATKTNAWYAAYVFIFYSVIQFIDNNFIVPKIVASRVKINALFSIIVVFSGNALWGVPGMFLSIPLLAIIKVICDHIDSLKPWGFLLGDTLQTKKSRPEESRTLSYEL
jgi:predicted PurR-regulated permease PerM